MPATVREICILGQNIYIYIQIKHTASGGSQQVIDTRVCLSLQTVECVGKLVYGMYGNNLKT